MTRSASGGQRAAVGQVIFCLTEMKNILWGGTPCELNSSFSF